MVASCRSVLFLTHFRIMRVLHLHVSFFRVLTDLGKLSPERKIRGIADTEQHTQRDADPREHRLGQPFKHHTSTV